MSQRQPNTRAKANGPSGASSKGSSAGAGKRSRKGTWLRRGLWTLLALFIAGVAALGVAYALTDVPKPNEIATAEASIVYYADGKSEMARLSDAEGNRQSVPLAQVSEDMQHAILAAEDKNFYSNNGISPTGIARAVWVAVKGGQATQGGSTITQQYVKNYFLTQDRTLTRKAREILISLKIDQQQSKDQILENYLNTIYYGRGAYGIESAARAYFGISAAKLDPAQSAFLASVIRGPSFYDPALGAEQKANAQKRSGFVLDAMVEKGWLTAAQRTAATFPETKKFRPRTLGGTNGYVVDVIKKELISKHKLTDADIQRGGLRIISTIQKPKQADAVKAVRDERPKDTPDVHVGVVSITPGDGAIEAMYGGEDFAKRPQNDATQSKMQAGSTFKIFTLIAALQSGDVATASRFSGASPQYFKEFADSGASTEAGRRGRVKNYGNEGFGSIDLLKATKNSVNTVYAQLNIEAGPEKTMKAAEAAGVRSPLEANMANVLGTDYVTVMDMATAYATIAAEGVRADPYIVKEIRFRDENVPTIKAKPVTKRVFDKDLMTDVIECMTQPVQGGTAQYVGQNLGRPAAGKTGTSESYRSAWFDGYVPQLAAAVGLYRSDENGTELAMENLPNAGSISGGTYPVRIWTAYMKAALDGTKVEQFPKAAHINKNARPKPPVVTQRPVVTQPPAPTTSSAPTTSAPPPPTTSAPPPPTVPPTPTVVPSTPPPTPTVKPSKPGKPSPSPTASVAPAAPPG